LNDKKKKCPARSKNFRMVALTLPKIGQMNNVAKVILKPGKDAAVRRFHPWIFSGAIERTEGHPLEGDIIAVLGARKEFLAMGHYLAGSIAVKIFSFGAVEINDDFWKSKLKAAFLLRSRIGLTHGNSSNAYRLVYSEGDLLPGLIIDYYNGVAVIQTHSAGMQRLVRVFTAGLLEIYGEKLVAVYDKSTETLGRSKHQSPSYPLTRSPVHPENNPLVRLSTDPADQFLHGSSGPVEITETGHRFSVDFINGQKTGFFLDQRGNRMFAQFYSRDKKVLNAFCYSGAFSVYALKGGAAMVHSIDSSRQAIEWTEQNIRLNGCDPDRHRTEIADVKKFLAETKEQYDTIILDPPAFAKTHRVTNNALHAYVHINAEAIRRLTPGGILFTFSCSQAISREMFRVAVQSAAIETGREIKILHQLSQGPDHPVSIYHPEGEYLKGLILSVE